MAHEFRRPRWGMVVLPFRSQESSGVSQASGLRLMGGPSAKALTCRTLGSLREVFEPRPYRGGRRISRNWAHTMVNEKRRASFSLALD